MASVLGHFVAGFTISKLVKWKSSILLVLLATISAFLPDIDVISFKFGIPYEHWAGHRGFTHSISFALFWGVLCTFFFKKQKVIVGVIIFLATLSHPILDALTTGGLGVALFFPFDNSRYFLPWRVIRVSPIGVENFLTDRGWQVVKSELLWVVAPSTLLLLIKYIVKKFIQ